MIVARIVRGVADHFILRLPEWLCALILFNFGFTLLQMGNTFDNPSFTVMRRFATEDHWGYVIVAIATIRIMALVLNGTFSWFVRWSPLIRAASATLCAGVFFALSLGIFLGDRTSPGARTYAVLMGTDIVLAIFIAGRAGQAERRYRNGRT